MNRSSRVSLARYTLSFLSVLIYMTLVSGCVALVPDPEISHHLDHFVVFETKKRDYAASPTGLFKICREFYRHYEDVFDLLVVVSHTPDGFFDQWGIGVKGGMLVVRHSESGTGTSKRDFGRDLGSVRNLKGVVQLANPQQIISGLMLHEFVHLWYSDLEVIPTKFPGHWGFSSVGGQLGGFHEDELISIGRGKYIAGDFSPQKANKMVPYSELEMYLAGWLPANEVPDFLIAEDGMWSVKHMTYDELEECKIKTGPFAGEYDEDCLIEVDENGNKIFTAKRISTWNIDKIIERLGPRSPNHEKSQKKFRAAFVLVTSSGNPFSDEELMLAQQYIELFTSKKPLPQWFKDKAAESWAQTELFNFWEATRGIATVEAGDLQSYRR